LKINNMEYKASKKCVDFIAEWEDFSPLPYLCSGGKWTIGFGHTEGVTESSSQITIEDAYKLLRSDIEKREVSLFAHISSFKLSRGQYDAIVSFVYNVGLGAFLRSVAYKEMKKNVNSKKIADSWITFRNAGGEFMRGLLLRRLEELIMYFG